MTIHSNVARVPITRMAVTRPPDGWFRGIARALFDRYRQALIDLGVTLFEVPLDAFLIPDVARIPGLVDDLRAFRPECAFGLPLGSYALLCRLPAARDGWRPNLFTDVLDIPTICLWDHAPVELADQLLLPHPATPEASAPGAHAALARVLTHPRVIHWSRDSGQTRVMRELGYLLPNHLIEEPPPVLPGFLSQDPPANPIAGPSSVGFVGHVYQEESPLPRSALATLAADAIKTWLDADERVPLWDVVQRRIAQMPDDQRRNLALDRDQTYFWHFAHRLICHQAQTALRLKMLGGARVPVSCHGNLKSLGEVPANLVAVPTNVPYGPELAALFARHAITIDVLSPGFIQGYSHKQVHGFASGGFMLMNRRQDFVDAFGDAGEAVSCVGADRVSAKIDWFLTHPAHRLEVGDAIRETIRARFQLNDVLARALHRAHECIESMSAPACAAGAPVPRAQGAVVKNLLPKMRTHPDWTHARVEHGTSGALVSTGHQSWSYAAYLSIPAWVKDLQEPHVRIRLMVDTGRVGLAALQDASGTLLAEQLVSATTEPVTVIVDLPREGARTVILRNTLDTISRARVLEASLCDRA